jgi:transposase
MRRLKISDSDVMEIGLRNEILRSEDARYDHRLHGVLLICRGFTSYEVGEMFGQNPTTIQRWVQSFQKNGFAGLEDCEKTGRPNRLTSKQLRSINKVLRKSPRDFGYMQNLWDGKLLSYHVEQSYKVTLGVRQCQRLFHQFGFRLRKPRPLIAHADPTEQEAFKKTADFGKEE